MILRRQYNGAKLGTETAGGVTFGYASVGERSECVEAEPEGLVERSEERMLA